MLKNGIILLQEVFLHCLEEYHDYCRTYMPKEHEKLKYLPGEKSLKVPFVIYADLEFLLKKVLSCQNNPENPYTEKKAKHKISGYAWCSICSFDETKNRAFFIGEKIVLKNLSLKNLTHGEADLLLHASLPLHRKIYRSCS